MSTTVFEQFYRSSDPRPWDLDGPTPFVVTLEQAGQFQGDVLDAGCGTGENALYLATRGHRVVGIDAAPTAIERAHAKAQHRGLDVTFVHGDACELAGYQDRFSTVLDSGLFHVLAPNEQARYVAALYRATRPSAMLHLLCFSDRNPPQSGKLPAGCFTHGVRKEELRQAFARGWSIESLTTSSGTLSAPGQAEHRVHFWLARIHRAAAAS